MQQQPQQQPYQTNAHSAAEDVHRGAHKRTGESARSTDHDNGATHAAHEYEREWEQDDGRDFEGLHWSDRMELLSLWLQRERDENVSLRRRALQDERDKSVLHERVAALTRAAQEQQECVAQLRVSQFDMQQRLAQHEIRERMENSRALLDKIGFDAPTRQPAAASAAAPCSADVASVQLLALQQELKQGQKRVAIGPAARQAQCALCCVCMY